MATNYFVGLAVVGGAATFDQVTVSGSGNSQVSATPVQLTSMFADNELQFVWPADHTGWELQAQTNSLGTNWFTIPGSDLTNQMSLALDPSNGSVFFRLIYP